MQARNFYLWLIVLTFLSAHCLFSQEKKLFLQHRFDGFTEIIDKGYTKEKLYALKSEFAKTGVYFTFSSLDYSAENELIAIKITVENKRSKATLSILKNKGTIPLIQVGTTDGMVHVGVIRAVRSQKKDH